MDFSITITRTLHLIGLSMVLGGTLTSFILSLKTSRQKEASLGSFTASHYVTAPGLILLLITGLATSFISNFSHFKYAGYMHAKIFLVVVVFCCMWIDIKGQALIRRSFQQPAEKTTLRKGLARRRFAGVLSIISLISIIILMEFKPF